MAFAGGPLGSRVPAHPPLARPARVLGGARGPASARRPQPPAPGDSTRAPRRPLVRPPSLTNYTLTLVLVVCSRVLKRRRATCEERMSQQGSRENAFDYLERGSCFAQSAKNKFIEQHYQRLALRAALRVLICTCALRDMLPASLLSLYVAARVISLSPPYLLR